MLSIPVTASPQYSLTVPCLALPHDIAAVPVLCCVAGEYSLYEVIHTEKKLTLVFEYLDQDLKQYMDECMGEISVPIMKVCCAPFVLVVPPAV